MNKTKALFIEFDNVLINTKSGKRFPLHSEDWELNMDVVAAIKFYFNNGYCPMIITNQDSVRDGYVHEKVFLNKILNVCEKLDKFIDEGGNCCTAFFYCIEDGNRRIPNNGLVIEAVEDFNVSLKDSITIGGNVINEAFSKSCFIGKHIDYNDIPKFDFGI